MNEPKVHVIGLSVKHQLTIQLLLYNLYIAFFPKLVADMHVDNSAKNLSRSTRLAEVGFHDYVSLTNLLARRSEQGKVKPKLLQLDARTLRIIVSAVAGWDAQNSMLERDDIKVVERDIEELVELIEETCRNTYTVVEVERMISAVTGKR